MDITRGSLDKISRPASSSRAYPSCRSLSASMEILTPEPCLPKVDSPVGLTSNHQRDRLDYCYPEENKDDREKSDIKRIRTAKQNSAENITLTFQEYIQNPNELSGSISNSDSGDDSAEIQTFKFSEPSQGKKITNSSNSKDSEETEVDPQIQAAIRKMNKLDTILAKKLFKERAIKKQGKEVRAKLWEELQSISTSGSQEEIENTKHFLALISSWQDTADSLHVKEDEICISVFHTQINPEDYDCRKSQHNQDRTNETKTNGFLSQAEKTRNKSNQDFIKKNIELAKDSGNQVALLEGEKKRLIELLKDTEDGSELQGLEEDASGWLVPGEGYTPEPMEFHHLSEIDIKLQVLSDGDFSAIQSSCSKPPSQIYQESLAYANRKLEAVPGERVLRYNKEHRDQQNRLKEIDHQLKSLEGDLTEEQMGLSEEQLKTLLEECVPSQRTMSNVTMPKSQESLFCGLRPPCYTSQDSTLHSTSTLSKMLVEDHIVGMLTAQENAGLEDKSLCVNAGSEIPGYYLSKALVNSHLPKDSLPQTEEPGDLQGLQKMGDKSITEGYFMSRALNTKKLKKPSFLGEPLYCISMNNEPSRKTDILSIPLQTKGGETLNNALE
nr:PREDICTED: fibrous sheath-interacting protein 1 isoform X1 [Struthio camelus australis]XP_009667136.1 PREDICTED: fibrous sheath-interacting protein 1 isoform X1 [Struthio camelus australis]XP_009667137.1 PREDICTED: fibrous sheath-interacting protein 1 isoform X1 [Struthio camelus australis]XP_009667138.1 PREDICTED: fibrous sheath-interacting protein 1 isoform X1 [Struthio camelus australis]XP_009667139.1 PREDICTED: fibrous sheath-interacting protein 1 isoform X1 [Struthio camelus australis]